jgi:hypothetical protein
MYSCFPPNSRYHTTPIRIVTDADGRETAVLARRMVPKPEAFVVQSEYAIRAGDRLDVVAWRTIGDAEAFWQLADANRALHPAAIVTDENVGRRLLVPMPLGAGGGILG